MSKIVFLLALLLMVPLALEAQDQTKLDGHFWNQNNDFQKAAMVLGMQLQESYLCNHTGTFMDYASLPCMEVLSGSLNKATVGDIKDEMNILYRDPVNRPIQITFMFYMAEGVLTGMTPQQTDKWLKHMRQDPTCTD